MKKALITGVTGQDGSYLAEFLLEKGYEVYGMYRESSSEDHFKRIEHLIGKINLVCGDISDRDSVKRIIRGVMPDEIYNLAAQSHPGFSFTQADLAERVNYQGVENLLEAIREYTPNVRLYQASTSELFGRAKETPQNEKSVFNPVNPYAKSKEKAHMAVLRERQKGLFACCGILYNHESPRRGFGFVTRKITDGIARIKLGKVQRETGKLFLELGNLNARRDWGFAPDYVEAMWLMLQQSKPDDYVIATGETHSVREFVEIASDYVGIKIRWQGKGENEEGYGENGRKIIGVNRNFFRPVEVSQLCGDASKARRELRWNPKVSFKEIVEVMVREDLEKLKQTTSKRLHNF
jgi:GDPmannose 4,6-dehydratase